MSINPIVGPRGQGVDLAAQVKRASQVRTSDVLAAERLVKEVTDQIKVGGLTLAANVHTLEPGSIARLTGR